MISENVKSFCNKQENNNTRRKTFYNIKGFLTFLSKENKTRNLEDISPNELKDKIYIFGPPSLSLFLDIFLSFPKSTSLFLTNTLSPDT